MKPCFELGRRFAVIAELMFEAEDRLGISIHSSIDAPRTVGDMVTLIETLLADKATKQRRHESPPCGHHRARHGEPLWDGLDHFFEHLLAGHSAVAFCAQTTSPGPWPCRL